MALRGKGAGGRADVLGAGELEVGEFYFLDSRVGFRRLLERSWLGNCGRSGFRRRGSADGRGRGIAELIGFDLSLA